jgi:streptogramin lyase
MRLFAWLAGLALVLGLASPSPAQILTTDFSGRLINYNPTSNSSATLYSSLAQPQSMVRGPDGFVYIANAATNSIDRHDPVTGAFVSTAVSSATLGVGFQPSGLAFNNGELYISNQVAFPTATPNSGGVFKYNFGSGLLSPVVTGLTQPEGLLFNGGNLYITELNNYTGRILKYDFVNPASTFIANGQGGLGAATGMTIGPDGELYVADVLGMAVRKYNIANPAVNSTFASGVGFNSPTSLAFLDSHMYVVNFGTGSSPDGFVSQFNALTGAFESNVVLGLFGGSAIVAVPEPTSLALCGLAAGGLWLRRRKAR